MTEGEIDLFEHRIHQIVSERLGAQNVDAINYMNILQAISKDYELILDRIKHLELRINKVAKETKIVYHFMQNLKGDDEF